MYDDAHVGALLYLPRDVVDADRVIQDCTWVTRFGDDETTSTLYDLEVSGRYIGVPLAYGMSVWEGSLVDRMAGGEEFIPPRSPKPRDEAQKRFMQEMEAHVHGNITTVGIAPPGSGKTVSALWLVSKLQRNTLVIVHTKQLMSQWIDRAKEHLGLLDDQIGIWSSQTCQWGRPFVVGTIQSVTKGASRYPLEAYRAFGCVIWDEVHRVNATMFSQSLKLFPATYRIALTATWERADGLHRLAEAQFGTRHVHSCQEAMPLRVAVHEYVTRKPVWGTNHGSRVKCVTRDSRRTEKVLEIVMNLWNRDRNILVVADNVSYLEHLYQEVVRRGIPDEAIGQYTGKFSDGGKERATDSEYLSWVEQNAKLIFATYAMMKEGIDIPRLDAGVEATPRSSGIQVMGRVRRVLAGKPIPEWHMIRDKGISAFRGYVSKRLRECRADKGITVRTMK